MKIILLRHGLTAGNKEKRYIGCTDEPLCQEGIGLLEKRRKELNLIDLSKLFISPMLRCIQSAKILYPGVQYIIIEQLKECNFGEFENKNYKELSGNTNYQRWIDSNGTMAFPEGESHEDFCKRCNEAFKKIILDNMKESVKELILGFIVHGGTIMSIMEGYAKPNKSFYQWHIDNGEGYICDLEIVNTVEKSGTDIVLTNVSKI